MVKINLIIIVLIFCGREDFSIFYGKYNRKTLELFLISLIKIFKEDLK